MYDGKDCFEFKNVFPKSKIYAFEADPRSVKIFKKINPDNNNVTLVEKAVSNKDGLIKWYPSDSDTRRHYGDQDSWSASSSIKKPLNHLEIFPDVSFGETEVESIRLDSWMANQNIDKIDVMWVDVNGGEREFIEGARNTLNKVHYLYMEFSLDLYEDSSSRKDINNLLFNFKQLGIYNFRGNYGNLLFVNGAHL